MIKFSKKIKKLFLVLVIFSITYSSLARPAQAYPSPTSAMNQILGDLGVDKGVLKEYVKDFNASRQKRQQPQVSLHFEPSNPIDGQKITATATPTYFMNESKNLYFTWYLQTKNCGEDDNPSDQKKAKCDLNDDGKIDIED